MENHSPKKSDNQTSEMTLEERRAFAQKMKEMKEEHYKRKEKQLRQKAKEEETKKN